MTFVKTHGMSFTREYGAWTAMKKRCTYEKHPAYSRYKGLLCDEWNSFDKFIEDMGPAPTQKHTIDRIDNNLGYIKSNCRWATMKEQQRNRRNSLYVIDNGKKKLLTVLGEEMGISYSAVYMRLVRGQLKGVSRYE